jgi:drug/metabolite transporter (DMT)-like permease
MHWREIPHVPYIWCYLFHNGLLITNSVFSYQSKFIDPSFWSTFKYQFAALSLFLIANIFIGYGVKFGYKALGNLTFVLASSKGLEMLILILMGYLFYAEIPTWKTFIGLAIVVVGLVVSKL